MDKNGILIALSQSDKSQFGRNNFSTQSAPQKVFSAIWSVESEVNNGGFLQYFSNSSCETAGFIVDALETIDAPAAADICRRAIDLAFPDGLPSDQEAMRNIVEDFSDEIVDNLEILDDEFFKYPDNLTELLFAYVSKHPEEFGNLLEPDDA